MNKKGLAAAVLASVAGAACGSSPRSVAPTETTPTTKRAPVGTEAPTTNGPVLPPRRSSATTSTRPTPPSSSSTAAADLLESTGFADACPIATIAGEITDTHEPMRVAAAAFESWMSTLTAHLVAHGADPDSGNVAAVELFCLVEGAFLLGRTTRSAEPVRVAGLRAVAIVTEAVASVRTPTRQ
jgi:Transcriptional regulator LmrA/YxaF-like, C-terminal domain